MMHVERAAKFIKESCQTAKITVATSLQQGSRIKMLDIWIRGKRKEKTGFVQISGKW